MSCTSSFGQNPEHEARSPIKSSLNYGLKRFVNPVPTDMSFGWADWRELRTRERPDTSPVVEIPIKTSTAIGSPTPEQGVRFTWVNHSTVLLEFDGFRVLTDPIWSERCSPFQFAGPRRHHAPGIAFDALPRLDAVIISHDHYDHLDEATVRALGARGVPFFVPLGVGSHMERWGVSQVTELDWWQQARVRNASGESLRVQATPARHFSGRRLTDDNPTLWASWALLGPRQRVWYGGDTGYYEGFKEIGETLGPFDLTVIPIGAYDKLWPDIHLDPEQAIQVHEDVRGAVMLPVHWGSFALGLHAWNEPIVRAVELARARGVVLSTPAPGETRVSSEGGAANAAWWLK